MAGFLRGSASDAIESISIGVAFGIEEPQVTAVLPSAPAIKRLPKPRAKAAQRRAVGQVEKASTRRVMFKRLSLRNWITVRHSLHFASRRPTRAWCGLVTRWADGTNDSGSSPVKHLVSCWLVVRNAIHVVSELRERQIHALAGSALIAERPVFCNAMPWIV